MSLESDDLPWPWGVVEEAYADYESFLVGLSDEEPSLDHLTPDEREEALADRQFLDWKYAKDLWEAESRHYGPEFRRSLFRIV